MLIIRKRRVHLGNIAKYFTYKYRIASSFIGNNRLVYCQLLGIHLQIYSV